MQNLVRKGMRVEMTREMKFCVRPCVFKFFEELAKEADCHYSVLVRGILEDYFDKHSISDAVQKCGDQDA